jgi:LysR family transcriptional regulator (chromosome initiation inhibitor)
MLDYPALAALAAVINEGSFDRAARALNVTASAVSQRVKLLEERVGRVLVARGTPCTATEAGRLLCRHVERVGMLEQDLRIDLPQMSKDLPDDGRVTLRVAVNADSLATWFAEALAEFASKEAVLFDIALDDQDHTIEWLRAGDVLAAVTANARPVQGCNSVALGKVRYVACASPQFKRRYFADGVIATTLRAAPTLTYNRKDQLQARWIRKAIRKEVDTPTHWVPSTQGFHVGCVAGLGWGMHPVTLVQSSLDSGSLVELIPGLDLTVPLYWQHTRMRVPMLERLTQAIKSAARTAFK